MVVFESELVHMWTCRVQHMRLLYSGCKPKQTGNPFISCHVRLLPLLLTALFTEMITFTLLALYLQTTMNKSMIMWTMNIVIFLNFWLMMIWWKYANLEYAEHVKSCHFHQHSSHGLNDSCSLCSRHQQLHLFTRSPESTVTLVLALLRKTLKFIQVLFLVFLILLAGDVETNPGPGNNSSVQYHSVYLTPKLYLHKMDANELSYFHDRLYMDTNHIRSNFFQLLSRLNEDMETTVELKDVFRFLHSIVYDKGLIKAMNRCTTLNEFFLYLLEFKFISFFNFEIVKYLIQQFCSPLESQLLDYEKNFLEYSKRRVFKYSKDAFGETENYIILTDHTMDKFTIEELTKLQHEFRVIFKNPLLCLVNYSNFEKVDGMLDY